MFQYVFTFPHPRRLRVSNFLKRRNNIPGPYWKACYILWLAIHDGNWSWKVAPTILLLDTKGLQCLQGGWLKSMLHLPWLWCESFCWTGQQQLWLATKKEWDCLSDCEENASARRERITCAAEAAKDDRKAMSLAPRSPSRAPREGVSRGSFWK
jgi:hypothetical protein